MNFESDPSSKPKKESVSEKEERFIPSPESIAALEDLETIPMGWQEKLLIFLAACEIKPATNASVFVHDSEDQETIEKIFTGLGLHYVAVEEEESEPYNDNTKDTLINYIIAHSAENLRRAIEAYHNLGTNSSEQTEAEFGLAMGFPPTAIEAFQKAHNKGLRFTPHSPVFERDDYQKHLTPEENDFTFFVLSRDHWQKELEWVHEIMDITKQYAPKIYEGNISKESEELSEQAQENKNETPDLYENPDPEQQKLNKIYHVIEEWYQRTMFEAPPQWVGYTSGLGFEFPKGTFEYSDPSLQRVLSLLHIDLSQKKIGLKEANEKLQIVVDVLEKFDPEKDIHKNYRTEFYETNAQEHISKVKDALAQVLSEVS